jgi:hypothetical protein
MMLQTVRNAVVNHPKLTKPMDAACLGLIDQGLMRGEAFLLSAACAAGFTTGAEGCGNVASLRGGANQPVKAKWPMAARFGVVAGAGGTFMRRGEL